MKIDEDRLRVLANGASYGEWHYDADSGEVRGNRTCVAEAMRSCDGAFIGAASPDVVIALLDRSRDAQRRCIAALYFRAGESATFASGSLTEYWLRRADELASAARAMEIAL